MSTKATYELHLIDYELISRSKTTIVSYCFIFYFS